MNRLRPDEFLRDCWQKQPEFLRQAVPDGLPQLDPDELAWLATLDDVESRLVFTLRDDNRVRYRAQHGPFAEEELRQLPQEDWTLLVNDVEKHLPEMRAMVEWVGFLPDWRLDDLMISFAAPGGGVGPHADNYDVFLCQGQGTRLWRYTSEEVVTDPGACDDLVLLRPFDGIECVAEPGDVLYLPPGVAHWGTAEDACLTYSIGMRAPRRSELCSDVVADSADPFYTDTDLALDEVRPGYISPAAIERAVILLEGRLSREDAARRLGSFVTSNKDWLRPDGATGSFDGDLGLHGMARIAWDDDCVYVNGAWRALKEGEHEMVRTLCEDRRIAQSGLERIVAGAGSGALLRWLLRQGAFETDA